MIDIKIEDAAFRHIANSGMAASPIVYTYPISTNIYFVKNIRVAKGAVPLFDRMMSDSKFITYGITFDVGKSTIIRHLVVGIGKHFSHYFHGGKFDCLFWVCYPKGGGKIKNDIKRETVWKAFEIARYLKNNVKERFGLMVAAF